MRRVELAIRILVVKFKKSSITVSVNEDASVQDADSLFMLTHVRPTIATVKFNNYL